MLLRLLAAHPRFAWPSNWMERLSRWPRVAFANRCYDVPWLGERLLERRTRAKWLPKPSEAQPFWRRHIPGFYDPDQRGVVPSAEAVDHLRKVTQRMCAAQGKRRLLLKVVGLSRLDMFAATFGSLYVVHLVRDPRAVVCSMLQRRKRGAWGWLDDVEKVSEQWPEEYRSEWRKDYPDRAGYLTFQWLHRVRAIDEDLRRVGGVRAMTVRYGPLVDHPERELTRIMTFSGDVCQRVLRAVRAEAVQNMNYKWREQLTRHQAGTIEQIVSRHGYGHCLAKEPKTAGVYLGRKRPRAGVEGVASSAHRANSG
jgi:sulfotransferase family protein